MHQPSILGPGKHCDAWYFTSVEYAQSQKNARRAKKASNQTQIIPLEDDPHREDPKASGSAESKWPALGYSTPGAGRPDPPSDIVRKPEALVQNQAESAAMLEEN